MTRLKLPKQMTGAALKRWRERQPSGFPGEKHLTPEEAEAVFIVNKHLGRAWRRWEDGTHPVPAWLQGCVGAPDAAFATLTPQMVDEAAANVTRAKLTATGWAALRLIARTTGGTLHAGKVTPTGYRPWWLVSTSGHRMELDGRTMRVLEERGLVTPVAGKRSRASDDSLLYALTARGRLVAGA